MALASKHALQESRKAKAALAKAKQDMINMQKAPEAEIKELVALQERYSKDTSDTEASMEKSHISVPSASTSQGDVSLIYHLMIPFQPSQPHRLVRTKRL